MTTPERNPKEELMNRINRVINTRALERSLIEQGLSVLDLQVDWPAYDAFESLPQEFRSAILAGETELWLQSPIPDVVQEPIK